MRLTCPLCGDRDRREFHYYGAEVYADRPDAGAALDAWDDYLHLRDNPAGETRDLWYHEIGCSAWIVVTRDTVSHRILQTALLTARQRQVGKFVYQEGDLREVPAKPGAATGGERP
ncbi:MAG: sarcosine oxidase subunit delta [Alphaproteobacteria bacterium HGW-Alphaproteobacteria-6]|nr:MAG: sarcosine oxidase subunit delta [Alphaproteobacteria bacterium HGW-Alphaproteobacteria-6]